MDQDQELIELREEVATLKAEREAMVKAASTILPYLKWSISKESPGYHPTAPSAIGAFESVMGEPVREQSIRLYGERKLREATSEEHGDGNFIRLLDYASRVMMEAAYSCKECQATCGPVKAINEVWELLAPYSVRVAYSGASWQEYAVGLEKAIDDVMIDLDRRARHDPENVEEDGTVILPLGVGVLYRLNEARERMGACVVESLTIETEKA